MENRNIREVMKKYLTSLEEMQKAYLVVELSESIQRAMRRQIKL